MVQYIPKKKVLRKFDDILNSLTDEPEDNYYSMEDIIDSIKLLREEIEKM